jgi:hypothetical protein
MDNKKNKNLDRRAAIVCSHVATEHLPILRAVRDEPTMPADSGWQFLCGLIEHENSDSPKVWGMFEVLDYEPSLIRFANYPPGTVLTRKDTASDWEISTK